MGQKVSPIVMRLGFNKKWLSRWFNLRNYKNILNEDMKIRYYLDKKLKNMSVDRVEIERSPDVLSIIIYTSRPGLIIGRGGAGIEELKKEIQVKIKKKASIRLDIREFKSPEKSAKIMAELMVEQLEKRIPYRRILKQLLTKIISNKDVKGVKLQVSGRLNGAEIARTEHLEQGSLPLQTLRADVDYYKSTAYTTYGTIGAKVWIYRGDVFNKKDDNE